MKKSIHNLENFTLKYDETYQDFKKNISNNNTYDSFINVMLSLSDLQVDLLSLRKSYLRELCNKFPDDYWVWYFRSCFLRYEIFSNEKAYVYAKKSLQILKDKNEWSGALSRNFITLAIIFEDYHLIDEEIIRLNQNPNDNSKILLGVVDDLSGIRYKELLKNESVIILNNLKAL